MKQSATKKRKANRRSVAAYLPSSDRPLLMRTRRLSRIAMAASPNDDRPLKTYNTTPKKTRTMTEYLNLYPAASLALLLVLALGVGMAILYIRHLLTSR